MTPNASQGETVARQPIRRPLYGGRHLLRVATGSTSGGMLGHTTALLIVAGYSSLTQFLSAYDSDTRS
jgi:hypothetical protein